MTEPTNQHLLGAIEDLTEKLEALGELEAMSQRMGSLERRTITIENARTAARGEYDENWRDVKGRLERIEYQTTRTNGRVTKLEQAFDTLSSAVQGLRDWKNQMAGAASVFSWWKSAVAGVVAGVALYLLNH